ncbi:uncharacterized protein [Nicotiana tomentosiformis]|uniref:uncharacterized protein n=1 Tax=Nicotiana tomentosiformis TaxID=4098 RepID=UPI0008789B0B|nr:pre-mRNA-splicing factor CWC22 homolog isoform X1 [Nicotiana tomentosiformis]
MDHLSPPSAAETPPQKTQELPSSSARASHKHNDDQKKYMHAMENFKALVLKFAVASVPTKSLSFTQRSLIEQKLHQFFPHFHPPDHPAYSWMIQRAIEQLNEEGGSYEKAISEYILIEWGDLPRAHVTILGHHLRNLCEKGEIVATPCGRYRLHDAVADIIIPYSSPSACTSSDSFSTFSLSSSCSSGSISSSDTSPRPKKKGRKRKQKKESIKKRLRPRRRECKQALRKGRNRPCWKDSLKEVQIEVRDLAAEGRLSIREEPEAMEVENPLERTESKDNQHRPAAKTELLVDIQAHRQEDESFMELIEEQVNEKLPAEEKQKLNRELLQERSRRNLCRPRKKWSKKEVVYVPKHAHRRGRKRGRPRKTELSGTEMPKVEQKINDMSIQDGNTEVSKVTGEDLQQQNDQVEKQQLKRQQEQDLGRRRLGRPLEKWSKKEIVYVPNHSLARGSKSDRPQKSNLSENILENVEEKSKLESNNEEPRGCQI